MYETVLILIAPVMVLTGILYTHFMIKKAMKREVLMEISEEIMVNALDTVLTETEMQKRIYSLGVLIGNGVKAGVGLNTRGGKKGLDGLLMDGLSMLFQGAIKSSQTSTTPQEEPMGQPFK